MIKVAQKQTRFSRPIVSLLQTIACVCGGGQNNIVTSSALLIMPFVIKPIRDLKKKNYLIN